MEIGLQPLNSSQKFFWINPKRFYELHDQTVEIYVEKTTEKAEPIYETKHKICQTEALGNGDNSFQIKSLDPDIQNKKIFIEPEINEIDEGLFIIGMPSFEKGKRIKIKDII